MSVNEKTPAYIILPWSRSSSTGGSGRDRVVFQISLLRCLGHLFLVARQTGMTRQLRESWPFAKIAMRLPAFTRNESLLVDRDWSNITRGPLWTHGSFAPPDRQSVPKRRRHLDDPCRWATKGYGEGPPRNMEAVLMQEAWMPESAMAFLVKRFTAWRR
jgi:hypothetical protein